MKETPESNTERPSPKPSDLLQLPFHPFQPARFSQQKPLPLIPSSLSQYLFSLRPYFLLPLNSSSLIPRPRQPPLGSYFITIIS